MSQETRCHFLLSKRFDVWFKFELGLLHINIETDLEGMFLVHWQHEIFSFWKAISVRVKWSDRRVQVSHSAESNFSKWFQVRSRDCLHDASNYKKEKGMDYWRWNKHFFKIWSWFTRSILTISGTFKNDVIGGEEGGGSDRLWQWWQGREGALASGDVTIKKTFLFKYFFLYPFKKSHFCGDFIFDRPPSLVWH